jgi:hypothetical protein
METNPNTCILYLRVGAGACADAPAAQKEAVTRHAASLGFTVVETYVDQCSGATDRWSVKRSRQRLLHSSQDRLQRLSFAIWPASRERCIPSPRRSSRCAIFRYLSISAANVSRSASLHLHASSPRSSRVCMRTHANRCACGLSEVPLWPGRGGRVISAEGRLDC